MTLLDKSGPERHEQGVVSRSLWFLVLLSTFLVGGARCSSALIGLDSGTFLGAVSASQGSRSSSTEDDFATGAAADDDSDDGADALLAPAPLATEVVLPPAPELQRLSFSGEELSLASHVRSLDRPPRA